MGSESASIFINPINDRGGAEKDPSYQFFPCNFNKLRISSQNFLTLSFNHFAILVKTFKAIPSANPKLLNLNLAHP